MLQVDTVNQTLGDCEQWIEPTQQRIYNRKRERADLLSDSPLHRTWEQVSSEQRLTLSGWRDSIFIGWIFIASSDGLLLFMCK